jgi:hypothetical protein
MGLASCQLLYPAMGFGVRTIAKIEECVKSGILSEQRFLCTVLSLLLHSERSEQAEMAELVDARDSKSRDRKVMRVRFPLSAPNKKPPNGGFLMVPGGGVEPPTSGL